MNNVITVSGQNNQINTSQIYVNGYDISERVNGRSQKIFMFADLRGRVFDGFDLSNAEFFGCLLNGTSFQGTNLHGARFIGCFSSDLGPPTDFEGSSWKNTFATGCHLNYQFSQEVPGFDCWPAEVVETAEKTLSRRNDVRHRATTRFGTLENPVVAPYLAFLLADEEWDVRLMALEALAKLRGESFSYRDQDLMKQMFLSLGDCQPIVGDEAIELIQTLKPDDEVLRFAVSQMSAAKSKDKLTGLLAAAELCRLDKDYSRLLDLSRVHELLSDRTQLVREECLDLLRILDKPETLPWVLERLNDPVPFVRGHAMSTIGWFTELPEAHEISHLLHDPDEDVRLYTLDTLDETGLIEPKHLEVALADASAKVRQAARKYQAEFEAMDEEMDEELDEAHVDAEPDVEPHFA